MQLLLTLRELITGEKPQGLMPTDDERGATRPMVGPRDRDATRPSHRIVDQKWKKIQKAIDQAG